jgi:3-methyl-2-oxobutanoate hydroxymethyltransferase
MQIKRLSTKDILSHKGKQPLVCLTAYTAPFAKIMDQHADLLLVGDSVGMALYGMESTLPVTLDMMINHGKAVVLASRRSCVVVDMPFGSYQESPAQAFLSAAKIMAQTGCQAVKLEGGVEMAATIRFLVERGVPVMGHVGLMPQRVNVYGGYLHHGKTNAEKNKIMEDAAAVQEAGAFAVVIEGVKEEIAKEVTQKLAIVVIGIGGSPACDGQILVSEDMLGLFTEFKPKFVKHYANIAREIDHAVGEYARDVRSRAFPGKEHCF